MTYHNLFLEVRCLKLCTMGMLIIAILGLNYEALVPDVREASIKTIIMFGISYDVLYILCCHI